MAGPDKNEKFTSWEANLINHCIVRRIVKLEEDLMVHWLENDDHKIKWVAKRISDLWDLFYKVGAHTMYKTIEFEEKHGEA